MAWMQQKNRRGAVVSKKYEVYFLSAMPLAGTVLQMATRARQPCLALAFYLSFGQQCFYRC
jgi:hypothetical protein